MSSEKPRFVPFERLLVGGVCAAVSLIWAMIQARLGLPEREGGEYLIVGGSIVFSLSTFGIAWFYLPRSMARKIGAIAWLSIPLLLWITIKVLIK